MDKFLKALKVFHITEEILLPRCLCACILHHRYRGNFILIFSRLFISATFVCFFSLIFFGFWHFTFGHIFILLYRLSKIFCVFVFVFN